MWVPWDVPENKAGIGLPPVERARAEAVEATLVGGRIVLAWSRFLKVVIFAIFVLRETLQKRSEFGDELRCKNR